MDSGGRAQCRRRFGRLARFEREAKVLASLDHPNSGSIYGIEDAQGKRCLILQLIEGETLTELNEKGP